MTVNVKFATVANSIAALSVSGVHMYDTDQIPTNANMVVPCMFPKPYGYISNITPTIETYGTAGSEKITLEYDLTYTYCHAAIAENLNFGVYAGFITKIASILVTLLTNDAVTGAVDIRVSSVSGFGIALDPAGNAYHGCDITLHVQEFCEVS